MVKFSKVVQDSVDSKNELLDASDKAITEITPDINKLRHVRTMNLSYNKLKSLPMEIGDLGRLEQLSVVGCGLRELTAGISGILALKELNLSCNRLNSLPEEFKELPEMFWLDLSHNSFTQPPQSLFSLTCPLTHLFLSENFLSTLPQNMESFQNLQHLDLSNNMFEDFPTCLARVKTLQTLDLSFNLITAPNVEIGSLVNLNTLNLKENPLLPSLVAKLDEMMMDPTLQVKYFASPDYPKALVSPPWLTEAEKQQKLLKILREAKEKIRHNRCQ